MQQILIIDDEPLNIKLIEVYLEDEPYKVFSAPNAMKAWSFLKDNSNIDLILLDRMMPDMDGVELVKRLKQDATLCDIPIIMQTAAAESGKVAEGLKCGVLHYLTKPYDQEALLSLIRDTLA